MSDLALDRNASCMHLIHHHFCLLCILLKGELRAVIHDGSESGVGRTADLFIGVAMIQMKADRRFHMRSKFLRDCRESFYAGRLPLRRVAGKQLNQYRG